MLIWVSKEPPDLSNAAPGFKVIQKVISMQISTYTYNSFLPLQVQSVGEHLQLHRLLHKAIKLVWTVVTYITVHRLSRAGVNPVHRK